METLNLLTTGALAIFIAVLVCALVEVVKRLLKPLGIPAVWEDGIYPSLALVLGIAAAALVLSVVNFPDQRPGVVVLAGLVAGLTASGIWAQASAFIRTVTQDKTTSVDDRLRTFVPRS